MLLVPFRKNSSITTSCIKQSYQVYMAVKFRPQGFQFSRTLKIEKKGTYVIRIRNNIGFQGLQSSWYGIKVLNSLHVGGRLFRKW